MSEKLNLSIRPRRNRKSPAIRRLVRETVLTPDDFIYPLFIHDGSDAHDCVAQLAPSVEGWVVVVLAGLVVDELVERHQLNLACACVAVAWKSVLFSSIALCA